MHICWYSEPNVDLVVVVVEYVFVIFLSLSGLIMSICKFPKSNVDPMDSGVSGFRLFFSAIPF